MSEHPSNERLAELAALQAKLAASVALARSVVSSLIPDDYEDGAGNPTNTTGVTPRGEKENNARKDTAEDEAFRDLEVPGRPARLGIGAKFLSHNQASAFGSFHSQQFSAADVKLRKSMKLKRCRPAKSQHQPVSRRVESDSEEEEESRTALAAAKTKKKKTCVMAGSHLPVVFSTAHVKDGSYGDGERGCAVALEAGSNPEGLRQAGFLSQYLSERESSKQKKKKLMKKTRHDDRERPDLEAEAPVP